MYKLFARGRLTYCDFVNSICPIHLICMQMHTIDALTKGANIMLGIFSISNTKYYVRPSALELVSGFNVLDRIRCPIK